MDDYLSNKLTKISFIATLMVLFLHSSNSLVAINTDSGSFRIHKGFSQFVQDFISGGITNVAVPIFFLISGYLFFFNMTGLASEFSLKFKKRIKSLLVPFLIWSLWTILLLYFLQKFPQSKPFFTKVLIQDYSYSELAKVWLIQPVAYQLWYIQHLLIIILLSPSIFWLVNQSNYYFLLALFIAWIYNYNIIFLSIEGLLYFSTGALLAIKKSPWVIWNFSRYFPVLGICWIGCVSLKTYLSFICSPHLLLIVVLGKIGIIFGLLAIWSWYDHCEFHKNMKFSRMAGFSFFIFVSHEPFLTMVKKLLFFLIGQGEYLSLLIYFMTALFTFFLVLFTAICMKRIIPSFYNLITGGR